jgi:FolB domain-containing protein
MMTFTLQGNCVYLDKIKLMLIIGAFEVELKQRQPIEISIAIESPLLNTLIHDDLSESYDYRQAYKIIHELAGQSYILVEYFAQTIAKTLLSTSLNITAVEVIIAKKGAFIDAEQVGCRICCKRD